MQFTFEKAFGVHESALHLQSKRAQLLAANVSNADTPKFKARDIDFHQALKDSIQYVKTGGPLAATNVRHIQPPAFLNGYEVLFRNPRQASIDGNTVEPEAETAAFMDNSVHYMASLRFLGGKMKTLQKAIGGQ